MPVYEYRREDGTTFEIRQKFSDDPLTLDAATGQRVIRVVQAAGIVFKGSGFYVNDSKDASRKRVTTPAKTAESNGNGSPTETKSDVGETKSETKVEARSEAKANTPAPVNVAAPAAAD